MTLDSFEERFWSLWKSEQTEKQLAIKFLPHKRPMQIPEEFLDCLLMCYGRRSLSVVELGIFSGMQKRFWKELLGANHVGVDISNAAYPDVCGDSSSESTLNLVSALLDNRKPDVIFIDADHKYLSVKKDFETWVHEISEDGVIFLHDIVGEDGVRQFWHELRSADKYDLDEICHYGAGPSTCGIGIVRLRARKPPSHED